eukprot:c33751_g1_i1 orf=63-761(+)
MALSLLLQQVPHPHHTYPRSLAKPPQLQGGWDASRWLCGITKRGMPCSPCARMVWVACTSSQTGGQPFWSFLFPRRFIYSSDLEDVDLAQLSELWAMTLNVNRDPFEIAKALKHSYSFVVVLDQAEGSGFLQRRLVGFGRAVSDGAFIATICDVAVDPAYQRRGIGRRIVKELVKNMKQKGGPTGFAAFPPPKARLFFWSIGFRSDRSFRFMTYRGRLLNNATQDEDQLEPE